MNIKLLALMLVLVSLSQNKPKKTQPNPPKVNSLKPKTNKPDSTKATPLKPNLQKSNSKKKNTLSTGRYVKLVLKQKKKTIKITTGCGTYQIKYNTGKDGKIKFNQWNKIGAGNKGQKCNPSFDKTFHQRLVNSVSFKKTGKDLIFYDKNGAQSFDFPKKKKV